MSNALYEPSVWNNLTMHDFLKTEWKPKLDRLDHIRADPAYYMLDTQHWKDIFEMRKEKYSNWLEYTKVHPLSSLSVNYENLVSDSLLFLKQLSQEYDMPCKPVDEWDPISCHAKWGRCLDEKKYVEEEYPWYQKDWEYLLENLDKDLEKKLGYI